MKLKELKNMLIVGENNVNVSLNLIFVASITLTKLDKYINSSMI